MLHQVSIFAANTKGALSRITSILARAKTGDKNSEPSYSA